MKAGVTFHGGRPQSGAQPADISVPLLDPGHRLGSSQLHERAQLLQRALEVHFVVGLAVSAMFGASERVVGHGSFPSDSAEAFPKNTDSEVSLGGRGGLTGTH